MKRSLPSFLAIAVALVGGGSAVMGSAAPQPDVADDTPRHERLFATLNGFAKVAGTTGGLGRRTIIVQSDQDSLDPGTLRSAVQQATKEGGGWIRFARTLAGRELRLTSPIRLPSNVTLDGGAAAPTLIGAPGQTILVITRSSNVIVANLQMRSDLAGAVYKGGGDCISVAHGADRIWIAHNRIGRCGDGQLDITQNGEPGRMRVTVAYNRFTAHDKVAIVQGNDLAGACARRGNAAFPDLDVTFYRNFFDGTGQRHPRAGGSTYVHWAENVVQFRPQARTQTGQGGAYGAAVTDGAAMFVENSLYASADEAARSPRFVDTRAVASEPGSCPGRLRARRLVTRPAGPVADVQPELVPAPPYTIPARNDGAQQSLFADVMAQAGPMRQARLR